MCDFRLVKAPFSPFLIIMRLLATDTFIYNLTPLFNIPAFMSLMLYTSEYIS